MTSTMMPDGRGSIWPGARVLSIHFNKATPATINCSARCPRRWARARQGTSEKGRRVSSGFSWQFPPVPITARRFGSIRCKIRREDLSKMQEAKTHWRVLVVEDEAKVARALREGLEREKYEVVVAPTGEEGFFSGECGGVRPRHPGPDASRPGWPASPRDPQKPRIADP